MFTNRNYMKGDEFKARQGQLDLITPIQTAISQSRAALRQQLQNWKTNWQTWFRKIPAYARQLSLFTSHPEFIPDPDLELPF